MPLSVAVTTSVPAANASVAKSAASITSAPIAVIKRFFMPHLAFRPDGYRDNIFKIIDIMPGIEIQDR